MTIREIPSPLEIDADVAALTFFEDERPLRGHAGMVDWRMNGAISRMLLDGTLTGREGESLIMPTEGRIPSHRLLLFGLGESKIFEPKKFQGVLAGFVRTVARLNLRRVAVTIPGSSLFSVEKMVGAVKSEFEKAGMTQNTELIIIK